MLLCPGTGLPTLVTWQKEAAEAEQISEGHVAVNAWRTAVLGMLSHDHAARRTV